MKLGLSRMTVGLALWITAAVTLTGATGAYLFSSRHTARLLDIARDDALAQSELIRGALEHAMLEDDRALIERMIGAFGREPRVVDVMLLDRTGTVQVSSGPLQPGDELNPGSPTCQACHRFSPAQRMSSRVIEARGGAILRTVVPIRNRRECHDCHDPADAINGVLISDIDAGAIRSASAADVMWLTGVSGFLTLLLVVAIGLVIRLLVLRRLRRFEQDARRMAQGDLGLRVPDGGSDTISWLAREFNVMAESVAGLIVQVRGERERLETVINSVDDGIVVLDRERNVVAANQAFIGRIGITREQLLGQSCRRDGAACAVADCPAVACLQTGTRQVRICERRQPDGSAAWEEVHACPVADLPGGKVHVVEVWRDISDRRAAEARLAESHRLASLGLLASGFSHEMNTPLATVLACVEGIAREAQGQDGAMDRDYIRSHASTARQQVLRCRSVTEQFLRMARGQPGAAQAVDVADAAAAAARLVEPSAHAAGVSIRLADIPPGLRVHADRGELQDALVNLVLNAAQACAAGGEVRLDAALADAGRIAIHVTDDGCGIAPELQARIFEPFFSARSSGTGLGLFLSLNFARRCGGDIVVQSVPGRGATFSLVLPAASEAKARAIEVKVVA